MAHLADLAMSSWLKYPARTHKESAPVSSVLSHKDRSSRKLEMTCDGVTTQGLPLFCPEHASPAGSKPLMLRSLSPPPGLKGGCPLLVSHPQHPCRACAAPNQASLGFLPSVDVSAGQFQQWEQITHKVVYCIGNHRRVLDT